MVIYVLIFIISCLLFKKGERTHNKWNKFAILAILIPCIMAALRGELVGTDTGMYMYMYEKCLESGSLNVALLTVSAEPSFYYLSLLSERLTGFSTLSFIYELITIGLVYLSLFKYKSYIDIGLAMFVFYCFIFPLTFNIVRQCAAMSVLLYGTTLLNKKKLCFIIFAILGTLLHTSCFIAAIFIYIIDSIVLCKSRNQVIFASFYIISLVFLFVFFLKIFPMLNFINIGKMQEYASGRGLTGNAHINVTDILFCILFTFIFNISIKHKLVSKRMQLPYNLLVITEIIFMCLGIYTNFLFRIAAYFTLIQILVTPIFLKSRKLTPNSRIISKISIVIISLTYWGWSIVFHRSNEIIPYYSSLH